MVNEDIVTSLNNAVSKGESLESAMQTAISSGYSPKDVQEAAQYVGSGVITMEKDSQENILTMPEQKKGFFGGLFSKKPKQQVPESTPYSQQQMQQQIKQQIPTNSPLIPSGQESVPIPITSTSPPLPVQPIQQAKSKIQVKPQPVQRQQITPVQYQQPAPYQQPPPMQRYPQPYPMQPYPYQKPQKQSYAKEIILLIMLLILAAILVITFKYRDIIVSFFSG